MRLSAQCSLGTSLRSMKPWMAAKHQRRCLCSCRGSSEHSEDVTPELVTDDSGVVSNSSRLTLRGPEESQYWATLGADLNFVALRQPSRVDLSVERTTW